MLTLTASKAREQFFALMDQVAASHEPILITGKRNNVVLISEEDWRSINETLYFMSIPRMGESLVQGMNIPIEEFSDEIEW